MRCVKIILSSLLMFQMWPAFGQEKAEDSLDSNRVIQMQPVVITATRMSEELEDVAVPVNVVPAEQIREQGAVRLSEVLEELPGLALFDDHGTGIQVQGFDPDYTLILIDGQPVIGRTAGTLMLDRLTVAGIERVEIVRGPSSSLYGSEALAGVINLITRSVNDGLDGTLQMRYGTHQTTSVTTTIETGSERYGVRALFDRYASSGYDLVPSSFGPTAPGFTDYTMNLGVRLEPTDRLKMHLDTRLGLADQAGSFALVEDEIEAPYSQLENRVDWSLHPSLQFRLSRHLQMDASVYAARYQTETLMERESDGYPYYQDEFDQRYGKAELQATTLWNSQHLSVFGVGVVAERLAGNRYTDQLKAQSGFTFVQHEWMPSRLLEVNLSARFDAHTDYAARLSPKVAVLMRPMSWLRVRASVGSGFKAPDFRQLYLNFTNAAGGYHVFGSTQVRSGLERLQSEGQITELFINPASLQTIRSENSVAYNMGFSAEPWRRLSFSLNAFHNDVHDLIDTQPIAQKSNGSFVYSYFNLARIYTQGVAAEVTAGPWYGVSVSGGYQFLQARDRDVIEAIREGTVFGRNPNGRDYQLTTADYSGLFGRSTHSGVIKGTFRSAERGLTVTLRGVWRGRYGYRDLDGNGLANRPDEFVSGYSVWNATLTKDWELPPLEQLTLQLGVNNLFGITRPTQIPSMPGRTLYAGFRLNI